MASRNSFGKLGRRTIKVTPIPITNLSALMGAAAMSSIPNNRQPYFSGVLLEAQYSVAMGTSIVPQADDGGLRPPIAAKKEWFFKGSQVYLDSYSEDLFVMFESPVNGFVGFYVDAHYIVSAGKKDVAMGKVVDHIVNVAGSSKRGTWEVIVYKDGSLSCDCPSWKFQRGRENGCKHTRKVQEDEAH